VEATGKICYAGLSRHGVWHIRQTSEGSDDPEGALKMARENRVKDIMAHIEEYDVVKEDDQLCEAIRILRENHEKIESGVKGKFHKTLLVANAAGRIVGKLSIFDLVRGLVPESEKKADESKPYYRTMSSRSTEVAEEVGEIQERFQWLNVSFLDLVKQEAQKLVKDVMSPAKPLLEEDDTINKAIYLMFREDIRQPLVTREGVVVGVVNLMDILPELLRVAGDECFWQDTDQVSS
jgi:CBS domain-containing protein